MSTPHPHRLLRVLATLGHHAATGTCALSGCHTPAAAYIDSGDPHPKSVCADHRPEAPRLGYITHDLTDTANDEACPGCGQTNGIQWIGGTPATDSWCSWPNSAQDGPMLVAGDSRLHVQRP
jgi:hypothetical protein